MHLVPSRPLLDLDLPQGERRSQSRSSALSVPVSDEKLSGRARCSVGNRTESEEMEIRYVAYVRWNRAQAVTLLDSRRAGRWRCKPTRKERRGCWCRFLGYSFFFSHFGVANKHRTVPYALAWPGKGRGGGGHEVQSLVIGIKRDHLLLLMEPRMHIVGGQFFLLRRAETMLNTQEKKSLLAR